MSSNPINTRRARHRRAVVGKADPAKTTLFVQIIPSTPSKINKRLSQEDRAGLMIAELQSLPGGPDIVKLISREQISITEYDSVSVRSRVAADAARKALA